jgi:hypothetical protein
MASIIEASLETGAAGQIPQTRETGGLCYIDFGAGGRSGAHTRRGWSAQELRGVWTLGPASELHLPATWVEGDHVLQILLEPYVCPPWCRGQFVRVAVNGHWVGEAFVTARRHLKARIDASHLRVGEPVVVTLDHPGFAIPAALQDNRDQRPLALQVLGVWMWTDGLFQEAPSRPDLPAATLPLGPPPPAPDAANEGREAGIVTYHFGAKGSAKPYLTKGWHIGEDQYTWTIAKTASLSLPAPTMAGPVILKLTMSALSSRNVATPQRLTVSCRGEVVGQFVIGGLHVYETVPVPIPRRLIDPASTLDLELRLPDAARPSDIGPSRDNRLLSLCFQRLELETAPESSSEVASTRHPTRPYSSPPTRESSAFLDTPKEGLAPAISAALDIPLDEMLKRCESLGDNCEFGIVQRKLGVEVLGLLRFANTALQMLINALKDDFAAIDDRAEFTFNLGDQTPREYSIKVARYGITWHTFVMEKDGMPEAEQSRQIARLAYLRRRFREGLKTGRKLYVLKDYAGLPIDRFIPVFMALNRHGRNRLLVVSPAVGGARAGVVEQIGPGLMRGHVSHFAPNNAVTTADPTTWLPMLANAWILARADGLA